MQPERPDLPELEEVKFTDGSRLCTALLLPVD